MSVLPARAPHMPVALFAAEQSAPPSQADAASAAARAPTSLRDLPTELQLLVVAGLDEDSQARLGAASRYWKGLTAPFVYPPRITAGQAVEEGRRHALGRLWNTPRRCDRKLTGQVDGDGMTLLMHAATTGDKALLRCLLLHCGPYIAQTDRLGRNAMAWASLAGCQKVFVNAVLKAPQAFNVGAEASARYNLHEAIASGHWHLTQTLLGPHHVRLIPNQPTVLRKGYSAESRLMCHLRPEDCAATHAPGDRPVLGLVQRLTGGAHLSPEALASWVQHTDPQRSDWAQSLRVFVGHGFDIHADANQVAADLAGGVPRAVLHDLVDQGFTLQAVPHVWGPGYLQRWLYGAAFDLASVARLDTVCQHTILAPTPAGRAMFRACLRLPAYHPATQAKKPLVLALLSHGVLPCDDIDEAARRIGQRFGMDHALWTTLQALGADVLAVDASGQTLAHAMNHAVDVPDLDAGRRGCARGDPSYLMADLDRSLDGLVYLASLGLDVQGISDDGVNPVFAAVLCNAAQKRNILPQLALATLAFDRPGLLREGSSRFLAHTMLEAALFAGLWEQAVWCLTNNVVCSAHQMADARTRLNAAHCAWPRHWFEMRLGARRLGLHGRYLAAVNPAGACHHSLSRGRLHQKVHDLTSRAPGAEAPAHRIFAHVLRTSAWQGAARARAMTKPITRLTDRALGTQLAATAQLPWGHDARGDTAGDARRVPAGFAPLAQTAALLACVPKALITAAGLTAGVLVGCVKGVAAAATHTHLKRDAVSHASPKGIWHGPARHCLTDSSEGPQHP